MLRILINSYACSPGMGSEPGMGWNWCVNLAKHCELHIITEGEFRNRIEDVLPTLPQGKRMHFYYNPVSEEIRQMCWNQGDWRFYKHYKKWQYKTYELAKDIVIREKIDVLHQLNMIGFREPGYLWKIEGIPLIWGPIGGLKQFPLAYLKGGELKMQIFNRLKNVINILQLIFDRRVSNMLKRSALLISSIPDSYHALKKYKQLESVIIPETGCFISEDLPTTRFESETFDVIWVGKFDFRKQLPLAIRAIAATRNKKTRLHIYGKGSPLQEAEARQLVTALSLDDRVNFYGAQSNAEVLAAMRDAQLLFLTSVSEDTSTVVLEAISNRLPVLCFDACGFGVVIDDKVGRKIALSNPRQSVCEFAEKLNFLEKNRELLKLLSVGCKERQKELSWDNKIQRVIKLYEQCL